MASDVSAHHALSHHKDGLTYVLENHAHFCSLISQYKQTTSAAAKLAMAAQLGRDFARHASAVERFLCPLVTAKLPFATKALVDRVVMDTAVCKTMLAWLEQHPPTAAAASSPSSLPGAAADAAAAPSTAAPSTTAAGVGGGGGGGAAELAWQLFDGTFAKLSSVMQEHMQQLDQDVVVPLRDLMTPAELSKLWDDLDWASRHGPTHPHPPGSSLLEPAGPATAASAGGTAAHVLQPLEGMLDRARDSISPLVGPTKEAMIGGGAAIGGAMGRAVGSVESQAPGIARKVGGWLRKAKKGVASLAEGGAGVGGSPAAAQNVSSSDRAAVTSAAAADAAVAAATQAAASSSSRPQDASPTALQQTTT